MSVAQERVGRRGPALGVKFDMRLAPHAGMTRPQLYQECLEQCRLADLAGFDEVWLLEHHGVEDGYLPSPVVLAAAVAARTTRIRIRMRVLLLPFYDPIRLAEDLAVVDQISGGRVEVVVGGGYRRAEFAMFGVPSRERGARVEEFVSILKAAWAGEPVAHRGADVIVTPQPVQTPRPRIILGGSSAVVARRAAAIADGYDPSSSARATYDVYLQECARLGRTPGPAPTVRPGVSFLHVARDPAAAWAVARPFAEHDAASYAEWMAEEGRQSYYDNTPGDSPDDGRSPYRVLTPQACIELGRELGPDGMLVLHPLMGGLPAELGRSSIDLAGSVVRPALDTVDG